MPFPYFIRKLFQNDGAGEKLNPSVIPTTVNGVEADASGNIAIKDTNIPNGPFLPLAGGEVSGDIALVTNERLDAYYHAKNTITGKEICFGVGSAGFNRGIFDIGLGIWVFYTDKDGTVRLAAKNGDKTTTLRMSPGDPTLYLEGNPIYSIKKQNFSSDLSSWYIQYANNLIVQGGMVDFTTTAPGKQQGKTVTFPLPFSSTAYCTFISRNSDLAGAITADTGGEESATGKKTKTTMRVDSFCRNASALASAAQYNWIAIGF